MMRYALSLKYAYLEVDAREARYEDYKDLGLLCPSCYQPVFLVKSRVCSNDKPRKTRNGNFKQFKPYVTESYFAHFDDKNQSKSNCSLYRQGAKHDVPTTTSNYSRQQRKKLFEENFQQILKLSPLLEDAGLFNSLWYRTFLRTHSQGEINSYLRSEVTQLHKYKEQLKTNVRELLNNQKPEDRATAHLSYLDSPLQHKLHQQTAMDAIDYLFSDSARQILLWLYRIGAIEALIFEQFGIYLREKFGVNSPQYRQKLLHFRYYAVTRSIFVLPYHELFSHGQLDTYFNQIKAIAPDPSLVVNLLSGIIAYTPWKIGFESDLSVPNLPNLKAVYITNRRDIADAYLSLAPVNGRIELDLPKIPVDLLPWMFNLLKSLKIVSAQSAILITHNLPQPMNHFKLSIHLNSLDLVNEVATFSLYKQNKLVSQLKLWQRITKKKRIKQLPKAFKHQSKFDQELLLDSPTVMFTSSSGFDYEHILLSLVNCYLLFIGTRAKECFKISS